MAGYIPHRPSPRQSEYLALDCLEAGYGGAAGGGKSDALLMASLQCAHVPGYAAMLFRRTHTDLMLPGALLDRAHDWLQGTDAYWDGLAKSFRFPSTASIGFGYLAAPLDHQRYQSAELQFVGFDEATQFNFSQLQYMFSRVRSKKTIPAPPRLRTATNPGGISHLWYQRRYQIPDEGTLSTISQEIPTDDGPTRRVFVPSLLADNPGIDAAAYRRSLAQLDATTRQQLQDGRWVLDTSGLVYGYDSAQHSVLALPELYRHESWSHVLGIDYGLRDDTAWCIWAYCPTEPVVYLVHAESVSGHSPSRVAERTQELIDIWHPESIVGDAGGLGAGYIEEARVRWGLPILPADKANKRGYISLFRGALQSGTAKILSGPARDWEVEAGSLLWADSRQIRENQNQPNHCTDAALYGWRAVRQFVTQPKVAPVAPLDPYEQAAVVAYESRRQRRRAYGFGGMRA
jgi:hypothetical protein